VIIKSYVRQTVRYKFKPCFRHVLKIISSRTRCKTHLMKTFK